MASVAGLSERGLAQVRGRLEVFADEVFDGATQRSEQRKWGVEQIPKENFLIPKIPGEFGPS